MTRGISVWILVVAALLVLPRMAAADAIIPISQERSISIGSTTAPHTLISAPDFGRFNERIHSGWTLTSQDSTIGPSALSGVLAAHIDSFVINVKSESDYTVVFDVPVASPYSLTGAAQVPYSLGDGGAGAALRLTGPGNIRVFDYFGGYYTELNSAGVLAPGTYTLRGMTTTLIPPDPAYGFGAADLSFTLTIAPEPSGAMVLAAGSALALRRGHS